MGQAPVYVKNLSPHSGRIERYLGAQKIAELQKGMVGWYDRPIHLLDVPGSLKIGADGDFYGNFTKGEFLSAVDILESRLEDILKLAFKQDHGTLHAGFSSISDALSRASQGFQQSFNGQIVKTGATGVVGGAASLWRLGAAPAAGATGSAAPGGRACSSATTGAMKWDNPAAGTMRLTGADISASIINNTILLYDRIFDVAKTMASTTAESVTGVPTRYQSSTTTSEEYAGGNFCFPEVGGTALAATAHNWTVCQYRNQAGTDAQSFPSFAGVSGKIVDNVDHLTAWFMPVASGDSGVMDLAQIQCDASVATGVVTFVIGHPIGFMSFPVINSLLPFDWLTNRNQAPYISNSACLALLEICKPATTATTYTGRIYGTSTSS